MFSYWEETRPDYEGEKPREKADDYVCVDEERERRIFLISTPLLYSPHICKAFNLTFEHNDEVSHLSFYYQLLLLNCGQ